MTWEVVFGDELDGEFEALPQTVQDELLASAKLLGVFGPQLGRPHADTLNDSSFANMKELRFDADDGVWRVAFAFDRKRKAILLVAGDKSGVSEKRFYKSLIAKADKRYQGHLDRLAAAKKEKK
ncbi:type II toxin-antitoxin system RelE/ParE family toxin [Mesorhizobium sp. M0854]|uniref:type II toxin-antitoxin system RelE/ParE family toxin n=1 Tax=Mesorhizobium sp. M0854 TaxID=2957013 RepID=UPI003337516D